MNTDITEFTLMLISSTTESVFVVWWDYVGWIDLGATLVADAIVAHPSPAPEITPEVTSRQSQGSLNIKWHNCA